MSEITTLQKQVLDLFRKSSLKKGFYWTGGTLLSAYYLHHRQSKDLDFFSDSSFSYNQIIPFIRKLKTNLKLPYIEEKKVYDRWEFFLHNKGDLRLEFVFYPHSRIRPRKKWQGISIDSLEDIAANKVMAFFDRNDPKDLFDLYCLLTKKKHSLKTLLKLVEKKFGVKIEKMSFWSETHKSLDNLDEIAPLLISRDSQEKQKLLKEIRDYFVSRSNQCLRRILK